MSYKGGRPARTDVCEEEDCKPGILSADGNGREEREKATGYTDDGTKLIAWQEYRGAWNRGGDGRDP